MLVDRNVSHFSKSRLITIQEPLIDLVLKLGGDVTIVLSNRMPGGSKLCPLIALALIWSFIHNVFFRLMPIQGIIVLWFYLRAKCNVLKKPPDELVS